MDAAEIEKKWKQRGFSFGVWTDPPGQCWEGYVHETDELLVLVEGEIEVEMNGLNQRPKPGEELLIPARTLHSVRNIGKADNRWFYGYQKK